MRGNAVKSSRIDVDELALGVVQALNEIHGVTQEAVKYAVTQTAKETAKEINDNAASVGIGGKKYVGSWSYKKDPNLKGRFRYDMVVYSKDPEYRVAHLLEKPHLLRNGKRSTAREHIFPVAYAAEDKLYQHMVDYMAKEI